MFLVLLTAENCSDNYNESQQAEMIETKIYQELEDNFVSEEMDAEQLKALEKRAVLKVQELADYLNIYADSALDVQFRKQARQMVAKAFNTEESLQEFFHEQELDEDLTNYLLLNSNRETIKLEVKLVHLEKSFVQSESYYKGQIAFQFQNSNAILGVRAMKTTKSFGNEKLDVWELFLSIKDK